jgi:hypothetical protein
MAVQTHRKAGYNVRPSRCRARCELSGRC